jgi:hypothetical protein
VFFIVNTAVEANLVLKLRKEIQEKRTKTEAEIAGMIKNNLSGSGVINNVVKLKRKKIEQDAKKETRVIVMVITNSVVSFVLRLPEILVFFASNQAFVSSILSSSIWPSNFFLDNVSSAIISVSYLTYILTFTTNVGIYYLFNQKFKQLFIFWTTYVKQK